MDDSLCAPRTPHSHGFKCLSAQFLALGVNTTAVSGRWWGRCWIKFDSSPYSTTKHSRAVTFVLGAPFTPPNTCRTPAASTSARASLSSGRTMHSIQLRSVRPLSRPPRPPRRRPACGALLVSLDFSGIAPIGAAPSCRTSAGNGEKRPWGCYPPGLSAIFWCRLSRSSVFSTCRPPVAATLPPRSVCAHNRSLHVVPAATRKLVTQEPGDHRFATPDPIGPLPRPSCPPRGVREAGAVDRAQRRARASRHLDPDALPPASRAICVEHAELDGWTVKKTIAKWEGAPAFRARAWLFWDVGMWWRAVRSRYLERRGMDGVRRREGFGADDRWPVPSHRRTQMRVRDLRAWTGEHFSAFLFLSLHDTTALPPSTTSNSNAALPLTCLISFRKLRDVTISTFFLPINSISSSAFGSCVLEPRQSVLEILLESLYPSIQPPCLPSIVTTRAPSAPPARPSSRAPSPAPRPPSAAHQPLDPQHYDTASDMSRGHKLTLPREITAAGTTLGAAHPRNTAPTRSTLMPVPAHPTDRFARPPLPPQYAPLPTKASYAPCAPSPMTRTWASRSLPSSSTRGHARGARITRRRSTATECTAAAGRDSGVSGVPDRGDQQRSPAVAFTHRYPHRP
ncbi:hypothetical protein B0H14DRAFT_3152707 [Mycena olivaceomarginata]|nr:hypothetical protein B0H14DRAFT_3152707 [Mycena olivaceomarginata]